MSNGYIPPRPTGDDEESLYHQAVWDMLWGGRGHLIDTPEIKWERTTKGVRPKIKIPAGQTTNNSAPTWL